MRSLNQALLSAAVMIASTVAAWGATRTPASQDASAAAPTGGQSVSRTLPPIKLPVTLSSKVCGGDQWFTSRGNEQVRNVDQPTLLPVLPPRSSVGPHPAVVILPGGGFVDLRYDVDGTAVAHRLADLGMASFVLKYRIMCTPRAKSAFVAWERAQDAESSTPGNANFPQFAPALADAWTAVATLRDRAQEFDINPDQIGTLGFSAGAITAVSTGQHRGTADSPGFVAAISPQMNSPLELPKNPAPLFIEIANDDPLFGRQGTPIRTKWQDAGGSVEMHIYEAGGHGFESGVPGTSSVHWFDELAWWLQAEKILPAADERAPRRWPEPK